MAIFTNIYKYFLALIIYPVLILAQSPNLINYQGTLAVNDTLV